MYTYYKNGILDSGSFGTIYKCTDNKTVYKKFNKKLGIEQILETPFREISFMNALKDSEYVQCVEKVNS